MRLLEHVRILGHVRSCYIRKNAFAYTFKPNICDYSFPEVGVS